MVIPLNCLKKKSDCLGKNADPRPEIGELPGKTPDACEDRGQYGEWNRVRVPVKGIDNGVVYVVKDKSILIVERDAIITLHLQELLKKY